MLLFGVVMYPGICNFLLFCSDLLIPIHFALNLKLFD